MNIIGFQIFMSLHYIVRNVNKFMIVIQVDSDKNLIEQKKA